MTTYKFVINRIFDVMCPLTNILSQKWPPHQHQEDLFKYSTYIACYVISDAASVMHADMLIQKEVYNMRKKKIKYIKFKAMNAC